jgi:hypothetical protein
MPGEELMFLFSFLCLVSFSEFFRHVHSGDFLGGVGSANIQSRTNLLFVDFIVTAHNLPTKNKN